MLRAIHLMTSGLSGEEGLALVEAALGAIAGVARVAAVASIGLVSVMYDDAKASVAQILRALRRAGFQPTLATSSGTSRALRAV